MPKSFSDLFEESNSALLAFLKTEVSLGLTFAGMAKEYGERGNDERYETSKRNAIAALETVQKFKGRLSDIARGEIERGSSELGEITSTL